MNYKLSPICALFLFCLSIACQSPQQEDNNSTEGNEVQAQQVKQAEVRKLIDVKLTKEALLGKIQPEQDSGFSLIASQYTNKENIYLRKQAYADFVSMAKAAKADGVALQIVSATRNFAAQKSIWEAKWNGQRKVGGKDLSQSVPNFEERALKILEYSSMPGTSRHHWGTDIDLNALSNSFFDEGEGKKIYDWLLAHGSEYGFCQVYTEKGESRPDGYNEERWHWSYMPLASQFIKQYNQQISYSDLGGFDGGEVAKGIQAIQKYVNGIAPPCKNW